jgi:uncharacterized protein (DUF58 family)
MIRLSKDLIAEDLISESLALCDLLDPPYLSNSHQPRPWQGAASRRRRGQGTEFWQFRPYTPGDDAARIAWRPSARYRQPLTKEHEDAVPSSLTLWVDRRPTMKFTTTSRTKQHQADVMALAWGWLMARQGDWLISVQGGPHRRYHDILALARDLETPIFFDQGPVPEADMTLLCSDFLYSTEALLTLFSGITGDNVRLCALYDPAEATFPYQGSIRFQDLGGGEQCLVEDAEALRPLYQSRYDGHVAFLETASHQRGWAVSRDSTANALAHGSSAKKM